MKTYQINLTCPDCGATVVMCGGIIDILSEIHYSGWPICPKCGCDMDFKVETI